MDDHLWHYLESPSGKFRYRNHTNILILSWSNLIIHIQSCLNKSKISCRIPSLLILSKLASNAHSTVNTAQENENHFRKHVIWFVYAASFRSAKSVKREFSTVSITEEFLAVMWQVKFVESSQKTFESESSKIFPSRFMIWSTQRQITRTVKLFRVIGLQVRVK